MGRLVPAVGLLLALVVIAIGFSVLSPANSPSDSSASRTAIEQFMIDEAIPTVTLRDAKGGEVVIDRTLPDKTLVTFWSSTCGECGVGLPIIEAFLVAHPEIKPIYINVNDGPDKAAEALRKYNVSLDTFYDSQGQAFAAWSATMPATYYIRHDRIRVFFPGRVNAEHLQALLAV